MANPAIVVILVAAADAQDPTTAAATRAAREALGPDAVVVVQHVESIPKAVDAKAIGSKLHADAVATVTWTLAERKRAHIQVIVIADGRALDRDLDFAAGDADTERGRTIGLTIVAMVPEAPPPPAPAPPPEPAKPTPAPLPAPTTEKPEAPPSPHRAPRFGLDVFALGASGPFGIGGGIGGRFLNVVSPRVAASLRSGAIASGATLRALDLTVGLAPQLLDGLGARVEVGVTQQSVSMGGEERSRLVGHARVLGEAAWWASPSVGIGLAAGVEVAFGETRVLVDDAPVGSIPRARFLVELSLRARR